MKLRPTITSAPDFVHHGATFTIESPQGVNIAKAILMRPMAITHQTDTEQRVLHMTITHDAANPTQITCVAPHGGHPHAFAPKGWYLLFIVDNAGIPSQGQFFYLH